MVPQTWKLVLTRSLCKANVMWGKLERRGLCGRLSAITDKAGLFSFLVLFKAVRPAGDL